MSVVGETTRRLSVRGASLHVVEVGPDDAPPLVVLHGGPGDAHDVLRPHLDHLAGASRRIVYFDQRGGGASWLSENDYGGWTEHVEDVDAVRRSLGDGPVDVLGFSWGALLALLVAVERPASFSKMVLVSPRSVARSRRPTGERTRPRPPPPSPALTGDHEGSDPVRAAFERRMAPSFADPSKVSLLRTVQTNERAAMAVWESLGDLDIRDRLSALRQTPCLVVWGAHDEAAAAAGSEIVRHVGGETATFERSGHAPFVEEPENFRRRVGRWLDGREHD